jgi:uracil-DNA glycosylase family 4
MAKRRGSRSDNTEAGRAPVALERLNRRIVCCTRCGRLREYCAEVAQRKRAGFRDWDYWGRPVPNFGDPAARMLIVGLAPAAHGANRTGRMFTGDRSGDFLFRAMHAAGFANQPTALHRDDGLVLHDAMITAACHCAPPGNKPAREELANCEVWLDETFDILGDLRVVLCLGKIGLDAVLRLYKRRGWIARFAPYRFGHAAEHAIAGAPTLLCSYHPSQQNTFTGKLTDAMLREVFERARAMVEQ